MILFYSVKKEKVVWCAVGILGFLLMVLCGFADRGQNKQATAAIPIADKVIAIDAGHGGFDGGATGNGVTEKEVNLAVSKYLQGFIERSGGVVVMTRTEDVSTADEMQSGISAKQSDLKARKELVTETEADVFVSVHINKFPQEQYRGAQVFYSANGKELGEAIQASFKEVLDDGNERVAKKSDGSIYVLKDTVVPSVIVECGFLSNPQEAELLMQDSYRKKIAWGIYLGLVRYFNAEP